MHDEEMTESNKYTLAGMYLEREPTPQDTFVEVAHVQEEMRDNWEVNLEFDEAVDILNELGVLVYPEQEEEDEDHLCISCLLNGMVKHLTEIDERLDNLEENV